MRIRQIKPGWWLDKTLRRGLSAAAREFYIGLWCLADDAGWLEWDVETIAAELYPFGIDADGGLFAGDLVATREAAVSTWAGQLAALDPADPHLVILDCGHAHLPKLTSHQRFGGRPVHTVRDAHMRDQSRSSADARGGSPRGNGIGTVGNGIGTVATSEAGGLKARLGDFASLIGGEAKP